MLALLVGVYLLAMVVNAMGNESGPRGLILGGGGPVGEAWESGVIAGLMERGIDVYRADGIIGTSAGSIVGARVAMGMPREELIKAALTNFKGPPPPPSENPPPPPDFAFLAGKLEGMNAGKASEQTVGKEIGAWAQKVHPIVSEAGFVESFRRRFPKDEWPSAAYQCAAVDVTDGSLRVWGKSDGVSTALAVASSCALPGFFLPVTINRRGYMDGGMRSATNADLARGCSGAIVLAPTVGPRDDLAKVTVDPLNREVGILRGGGCKVELVVPDASSMNAFGGTLGDESRAGAAMEAGRAQGRGIAPSVAEIWK